MYSYEQSRQYGTTVDLSEADVAQEATWESVSPQPPVRTQPWMIPTDLRIFHGDRIYWIRARVNMRQTWATMLEQLLSALRTSFELKLPTSVFSYTFYDMTLERILPPLDVIGDTKGDEILLIHKSEFVHAYDDERRARLVAEMVRGEGTYSPPESVNVLVTVTE